MLEPTHDNLSHRREDNAVSENADPLRMMVAETGKARSFRMREPDTDDFDTAMAPRCNDNQSPWRWTDNPAEAQAGLPETTTSSNLSTEAGPHVYAPQLSSHEMVAGQLYPHLHEQHALVQPEAGPSTHYDSLSSYTRDPRNFIIDSVYPATPHIVITRPEPVWDEYYLNAQNRTEYQWPTHLSVPPPARGYNSPAEHPVAPPEAHVPALQATESVHKPTASRRRRKLPPAFNKAQFNEMIDYAVWDRESYPSVVSSLLRRLYLLSVCAAADEARSWRPVYDHPAWSCSIDKPFTWSDPAHPVLATYQTYRGTTIIDSITPLRAPHIVINEPPPQNPWIGYFNIPSDPQDAGFGSRLTVPWARIINEPYVAPSPIFETYEPVQEDVLPCVLVPEANKPEDGLTVQIFAVDIDLASSEDDSLLEDEVEGSSFELDESDEGSDDSRPDTPAPETPMDSPVLLRFRTGANKAGALCHLDVPSLSFNQRTRPRQLSL